MIHSIKELMELSEDELNEALLEDTYNNKANLRELVRRTLIKANEYRQAFEYEKSLNRGANTDMSIDEIKRKVRLNSLIKTHNGWRYVSHIDEDGVRATETEDDTSPFPPFYGWNKIQDVRN
ncbi:hypothetical protein P8918_13000 [Bacillus spizizenii]|nr:hypothetical protein [Bacillus spizizenii]MCY8890488.1 hypothetical protein [Bacillus spizizenii]MEC0841943.1 hypothetical protein [Bacillus spizizenii]